MFGSHIKCRKQLQYRSGIHENDVADDSFGHWKDWIQVFHSVAMQAPSTKENIMRRIHVHRRRSPWRTARRASTMALSVLMAVVLTSAVLIDAFYPRTLTHDAVTSLARRMCARNETSPILREDDLKAVGISSSVHLIKSEQLSSSSSPSSSSYNVLMGTPPIVATATLVYFTPAESLTIVTFPSSVAPVIHPATPARTALHPLRNPLFLSFLPPSAARSDGLSRRPFTLHAPASPAIALLHEDGPLFAHHVLNALRQTALTADPTHVVDALSRHFRELRSYLARSSISLPSSFNFATSLCHTALQPLRAIAAEARRRANLKPKQNLPHRPSN